MSVEVQMTLASFNLTMLYNCHMVNKQSDPEPTFVLLDETLCSRSPDLSLSGTAGWLWSKSWANTGLDMA